jgi:hypothetical protein
MQSQTILLIILAAIVAAGLAWFQYYRGKRRQNPLLLASLRFLTWFALFLLLLNPKFSQKSYTVEKPTLVVAVDNSASIDYFGEGERVMDFLEGLLGNEALRENFNIQTYAFGENLQPKDSAFSFSEGRTEIGKALRQIQQVYKGKTAPVVLVTDGNQTFGENYTYTAKQLEQPIFPLVVGDTMKYTDLRIEQLNVNRYVFLNNKFPVEVFVNYTGSKAVSQEFRLKQGNSTVFRKTLEFSEENISEKVMVTLPSRSAGVKTYSAVIQSVEGEKNTANNTRNFAIEVIDEKTNVLILASVLHPDLGALKKSIESNQQRSAEIKTIGEELDLGKYQLVVLYQPTRLFQPVYEKLNNLKANTFTITGTETDYAFLNSVQEGFKKQSSAQDESYLPVFNLNYTVFQLEDIGFDDFPPLKDQFGKFTANVAFHPILHKSVSGIQTEEPMLMTLEKEEQRKAYLFGEGIWKWRAKSYLDERSFEKFDEFFGKLVQYLASDKRRSRLELEHESFYRKGDQLVIEARYFDKNYVFDPRAELQIRLKNKASGKISSRPFLLKNNSYEVNLSDLSPGEYQFTVSVEGQSLAESGEFTLIAFDVEKQFMNADVEKLQQIATDSQVYFPTGSESLANDLLGNTAFKPVQKSRETTMPLIEWYWLLGIIVLALAVEWFVRKYRGLV